MALKNDRWQALLDQADGEDGDKAGGRLVAMPGMMEISYSVPVGAGPHSESKAKTEMVYQDTTQRDKGPKLLVSLASVINLKRLCEYEHAKHDEVLETLKVCRFKYYKEIRWLRDQLQRATGDEGQVFWFDPQDGAEHEPTCGEAMLRELQDANGALREEVAALNEENARLSEAVEELENPENALRALVRGVSGHGAREVTTRLRRMLSKGPDAAEFAEVLRELAGPDPERARLEDELPQLRQKSREDEEQLAELRSQANELRAELQWESKRAELEVARVAEAQKRVQQIEAQNQALTLEMLNGLSNAAPVPAPPDEMLNGPHPRGAEWPEDEIAQMRATISGMRDTTSSSTGQLTVTTRRLVETFSKLGGGGTLSAPTGGEGSSDIAHDSLEEAISHLDFVAAGVGDRVQAVLRELQDLRSRAAQAQQDAEPGEAREPQQEEAVARLEEQLAEERAKSGELAEGLRAEVLELRRRLQERGGGAAAAPGADGAAGGAAPSGEEAAAREADEDQPAAASPPQSARLHAALQAKVLAQRPTLILAEKEQAAEALAFMGSETDDLGRFLWTAVQVQRARRFLRPARHREAEYIQLTKSMSPRRQSRDQADRAGQDFPSSPDGAESHSGHSGHRATVATVATPRATVARRGAARATVGEVIRLAGEQGAGMEKPHARSPAGQQGAGAETPHARSPPHVRFLASEQGAGVEKPRAGLQESPPPPPGLRRAVRSSGLESAVRISRSPSLPARRRLEAVPDLSEVIRGQQLLNMAADGADHQTHGSRPSSNMMRIRTDGADLQEHGSRRSSNMTRIRTDEADHQEHGSRRSSNMTRIRSEPVMEQTTSLPPLRQSPNRRGESLGPNALTTLTIAQRPGRARMTARLPFQVDV